MKGYTMTEQNESKHKNIKLECGCVASWIISNPFGSFQLHMIKLCKASGDSIPRRHISEEERKRVADLRPISGGVRSTMKHKFLDRSCLLSGIRDLLIAECRGIMITTANRDTIAKIYFNTIGDYKDRDHDLMKTNRDELIKKPANLVEYIDEGYTLIIVIGFDLLFEYYLFAVPGTATYIVSEIQHDAW